MRRESSKEASVRDRFFFVAISIVALTTLCIVGAICITVFGPSPPTLYSQRLFDALVYMMTIGFAGLLGVLGRYGHGTASGSSRGLPHENPSGSLPVPPTGQPGLVPPPSPPGHNDHTR